MIIKNLNITVEVKSGTNLYNLLIENNVVVPSLCKGSGQCGKCKVRVTSADGKSINKPSKKDTIILAPISIDAGFRLACQYEVKSDIVVDISEFQKNTDLDSDIIAVKKKGSVVTAISERPSVFGQGKNESETSKQSSGKVIENNDEDVILEELIKPQVIKVTPRKKQEIGESIDDKSSSTGDSVVEIKKVEDIYDPVEGIILIQYPQGIKYFTYSPSIDNISGEGFNKNAEKITSLLKDNTLIDFIYNGTSAKNIERVLLIDDKTSNDGDILLNLINYKQMDLNGIVCEYIAPYRHPKDLLSFFRLIINFKDGTLNIPLDNLADCYFCSSGKLIHLNANYVVDDIKISEFLNVGKNPIIDVSTDLSEIITKDKLISPDSMLLNVFIKVVSNLKAMGIVDNKLILKSRNELMDKIPLELLVKLSYRNEQKLFNIYRSKEVNIYISQRELDSLNYLRVFINTLCSFVEKNCGKIDSLTFHTLAPFETLVNEFLNMGIIPAMLAKKCKHQFGDPAVHCIKLFGYKNIPDFVNKNFGEEFGIIELYKNEDYNSISSTFEKEFF
ncbi:MAG: 2Fe-2S iron-sulfur cluster-binding protein [Calditerrivibrio sp.]|uniref:2Fe-2S iron-sulfur cluster-binding protein n=1 Tax=Calditerrivibrio sp. TaxID=2792612 RepID=UPI003D10C13A